MESVLDINIYWHNPNISKELHIVIMIEYLVTLININEENFC